MKERWRPFLETPIVSIYQKKDKSLIVSEKEFTLQTSDKIFKRQRKMKERYSHFQFSNDVYNETDKSLTNRHYSEKGGHKARHDFKEIQEKLKNIIPEEIIFREEQIFPGLEQPPKKSVYDSQKWLYESKKREMKKK